MIKFSVGSVALTIDFSFFAVIAILFMTENGYNILCGLSVCFIHEIGHIITMLIMNERIKSIGIYGTGIKIIPYRNPFRAVYRDIIILFSGALLNFITALCTFSTMPIFSLMNLCIGIFNLLPYRCSDGGEIFTELAEYYGNNFIKQNSYRILRAMSIAVSVLILIMFVHFGIFNFTLVITLVYLICT